MVFTSSIFLFLFLPAAVGLFYAFPARWRSIPILAASVVFYAWGEPVLVLLILGTAVVTFLVGRRVGPASGPARKAWLTAGTVAAVTPLAILKYGAFAVDSVGGDASSIDFPLPIGVSFYTFMAIGYLVDIYRRRDDGSPSLLRFASYLTMFPHLVAGPIVRWKDIGHQLANPRFDAGLFGYGAIRVATGLAKKAVLADSLAVHVDLMFATGAPASSAAAWLAVALFALQIYLDFSAYSDIAIGLAAMMGVRFHENFRYPYVARSAREFWQRWHISLGSWFRDYVYIPMGGSRVRPALVWRNLAVVWALTGLWHGAAWTFVLWGLYFGLVIGLERFAYGKALERLPRVFQHVYGLLVALLGWVFFRSDDIGQVGDYFASMAFAHGPAYDAGTGFVFQQTWGMIAVGGILAGGAAGSLMRYLRARFAPDTDPSEPGGAAEKPMTVVASLAGSTITAVTLVVATAFIITSSYAPFIYFRF